MLYNLYTTQYRTQTNIVLYDLLYNIVYLYSENVHFHIMEMDCFTIYVLLFREKLTHCTQ